MGMDNGLAMLLFKQQFPTPELQAAELQRREDESALKAANRFLANPTEYIAEMRNQYKDYQRNDPAGQAYFESLVGQNLSPLELGRLLSTANPANPFLLKDAEGHIVRRDDRNWMDKVGAPIITALAGAGVGAGIGGLLAGGGAATAPAATATTGATGSTAGAAGAGATAAGSAPWLVPGAIPEILVPGTIPTISSGTVGGALAGGSAGSFYGVNNTPSERIPQPQSGEPTPEIPDPVPDPVPAEGSPWWERLAKILLPNGRGEGTIPAPDGRGLPPNPDYPAPPVPDQLPPEPALPWWARLGTEIVNGQLQNRPDAQPMPMYGIGAELQNPDYGPGVSGIYNPSLAALIQMKVAQNTAPRRTYG
jgi:hypothetical protein